MVAAHLSMAVEENFEPSDSNMRHRSLQLTDHVTCVEPVFQAVDPIIKIANVISTVPIGKFDDCHWTLNFKALDRTATMLCSFALCKHSLRNKRNRQNSAAH